MNLCLILTLDFHRDILKQRIMNGCLLMQVPKEEIKKRIIEAAEEELLVSGYRHSSMRNIAQQAGITVGNIYSYFSGKDDLLDNILQSTIEQLRKLVFIDISDKSSLSTQSITYVTEAMTKVFLDNRTQFLILMKSVEGSKYENIKAELIELVKQRLENDLFLTSSRPGSDMLLADSLAVALIEGIINIFNKYGGDEERLANLLNKFLLLIIGDIQKRI